MGVEVNAEEMLRRINRGKARRGEISSSDLIEFDTAYDHVMKAAESQIQEYLDEVSQVNSHSTVRNKNTFRKNKAKLIRIFEGPVYRERYNVEGYTDSDELINDLAEEMLGRSILSHAFEDPAVSDIYCMEWNNIWVERNGVNERYPYTFRDEDHYDTIIKRILQFDSKEVNQGDGKIVDSTFYEDRIAVTDKTITPKGYSLTIRKHNENHITLDQIIEGGTFNKEMAELLGLMIQGESNMIYAGITGSGKTTSIRALLDYYATQQNKRMVVAEDTQELFPANEHTVELKTVKSNNPNEAVTLRDLITLSLRMKPKYIVVGEVRGVEAEAAVEAMATGHSTVFTMHGGDAWDIINRLITKYLMQMPELSIEVVERIVSNAVDYIAVQDDIPGIGRRVSSIKEVSYDFEKRTTRLVPIVEYDFETDEYVHVNKLSPDKASFMMRRGVPYATVQSHIRDTDADYISTLEEFKDLRLSEEV